MSDVAESPSVRPGLNKAGARFYEPHLDALRFFSFAAVFCFHVTPGNFDGLIPRLGHVIPAILVDIRNAFPFGVCMFFLLSSYLITKLLILEQESTGSVHIKAFYVRRILRIWPLYLSFLLAMWGLAQAHLIAAFENSRLLAFLLFSGNVYVMLFDLGPSAILPLWTISIEEQFYLTWPAIARFGVKSLRRAAWILIVLSVAATAVVRLYAPNPAHWAWMNSLVQFQFFAFGALIAIRFAHRRCSWPGWVRWVLIAGGVASILAASHLHVANRNKPPVAPLLFVAGWELLAVGIACIFLAVLSVSDSARKGPPKFLTYLGKISFGLYVFHQFALDVAQEIAIRVKMPPGFHVYGGAALTLVLAMLSYRFLEKPFLLLKERFTFVHSRAV